MFAKYYVLVHVYKFKSSEILLCHLSTPLHMQRRVYVIPLVSQCKFGVYVSNVNILHLLLMRGLLEGGFSRITTL